MTATDERQLLAAIRTTITAGRDRGDGSSAILGQIESLLAGVEAFRDAAATSDRHVALATSGDDRDGYEVQGGPKPAGVEGLAHERGGAWHTQPSGEHRVIEPANGGA